MREYKNRSKRGPSLGGVPRKASRRWLRLKFVRQSGGKGQYGYVKVRFGAAEQRHGFNLSTERLRLRRVNTRRQGAGYWRSYGNRRVMAGHPVVDLKLSVADGSF